ncbi:unnamed protein product, partial [Rotaria socialis]
STYVCRVITSLLYAFDTTLLPLLSIANFGWITIKNVHNIHTRTHIASRFEATAVRTRTSGTSRQVPQSTKLKRHLLKMLIVQVLLLFLFTAPHTIQQLYLTFVPNTPEQPLHNAIDKLIYDSFSLLTFIASGMPFYIYTIISGTIFRKTLLSLFKTSISKTGMS